MQISRHALECDRMPSRRELADLARVVGERMREAREVAGLTQVAAAKRLGYASSGNLARVEHSQNECAKPAQLWTIVRAARLYDVTADFLLGLSSDWDPAEVRIGASFMADLRDEWDRQRERDIAVLAQYRARLAAVLSCVESLVSSTGEAAAALDRFRDLNGEFEDMPGGSRLVHAVEQTAATAGRLGALLKKYAAQPPRLTGPEPA